MDDAFSLIATEMPRARRLSPFGVRVAAGSIVTVLLLVSFGAFVVGQQRAADERRSAAMAAQVAAHEAEARAAAAEAAVTTTTIHASDRVVNDLIDTRAREAATAALDSAVAVARASSLEAAIATALSSIDHDVLFIDGPSTGPSVVSVFASAAGWSAAVQGSARSCYWVALTPGGATRYGTGARCTGMAALAADRNSW
jgi:hypothetical protein